MCITKIINLLKQSFLNVFLLGNLTFEIFISFLKISFFDKIECLWKIVTSNYDVFSQIFSQLLVNLLYEISQLKFKILTVQRLKR